MTPDSVEQLIRERAGWLSPELHLYPCMLWHHIDGIAKVVPHFKELIDDQKDEFDQESQMWIERLPEGEHPEWHNLEMAQDDARSSLHDRILKEAYQMGYVRIGIIYTDATVRVEGLAKYIDAVKREIENIRLAAEAKYTGNFSIERWNYK